MQRSSAPLVPKKNLQDSKPAGCMCKAKRLVNLHFGVANVLEASRLQAWP